jgi:hypothetical protein
MSFMRKQMDIMTDLINSLELQEKSQICLNMKSISLLLGAGFSAPKGYPLGNKLNQKLVNFNRTSKHLSPGGILCENNGNEYPSMGWDEAYDLCFDLIGYYDKKNGQKRRFDYEKFYDYLQDNALEDENAREIAQKYITPSYGYNNLIKDIREIYNQLVLSLIKDRDGKNRYDDVSNQNAEYPGYTGFLKYLSEIKDHIVHIHTLNHDLLFESFNGTKVFEEEKICDGFTLPKSKYYSRYDSTLIYCKLERYTGRYDTRFRLYKLHGSLNYYKYYINRFAYPIAYVKHIPCLDGTIYKECRDERHRWGFVQSAGEDLCADFLTGTTAKIERYKEKLLYKKLFKKFASNLKKSEKLIIIGYGAKDSEINNLIKSNFDFENKPVYVVNPRIKDKSELAPFFKEIQAKLITTKLHNVKAEHFS